MLEGAKSTKWCAVCHKMVAMSHRRPGTHLSLPPPLCHTLTHAVGMAGESNVVQKGHVAHQRFAPAP